MGRGMRWSWRAIVLAVAWPLALAAAAAAQEPELVDPDLAVRSAASGLNQPVSMAFLGRGDMPVLEKASGQVKRVVNGQTTGVVLDLPVNSASERGLLGIALHPKFRRNGWVYLFWSESRTGADSTALDGVRLLGNRVDRFEWNGHALEFDRNIIQFRAFQADADQPLRGNHNGGVLRFGPDGKLYVIVGDTGRRGQLQNLPNGGRTGRRGRPVRRARTGRRAPDRRDPAAQRRRLRSARQPVLRRRPRDARRSRRERPEALRVRAAQLVRHGV
jgi:glucose/arabinose dehydrogenase